MRNRIYAQTGLSLFLFVFIGIKAQADNSSPAPSYKKETPIQTEEHIPLQFSESVCNSPRAIVKPGVADILFWETFNKISGIGGNDNIWNQSKGTGPEIYDNPAVWGSVSKSSADRCVRIGIVDRQGTLTTPSLNFEGNATLSFRAGSWDGDSNGIGLSISGGGSISSKAFTLKNGMFTRYQVTLSEMTMKSKIKFAAKIKEKNRFFLDEIMVYRKLPVDQFHPGKHTSLLGDWGKSDFETLFSANPHLTSIDLYNGRLLSDESVWLPENSNCLVFADTSLNLAHNEVINDVCETLVINDHQPFDTPRKLVANKARYSRNAWQDGGWETLMLPFPVSAEQLPKTYMFDEFSSIDDPNGLILFTQVNELKANTPYIMKYTGTSVSNTQYPCSFEMNDVTIGDAIANTEFIGVYAITRTAGKMILGTNKEGIAVFGTGMENSFVTPFHAYIDQQPTSGSKPFRVTHQPNTPTHIAETGIVNDEIISNQNGILSIYARKNTYIRITTIDGRTIRTRHLTAGHTHTELLPRGFYLVNGKKTIIQ